MSTGQKLLDSITGWFNDVVSADSVKTAIAVFLTLVIGVALVRIVFIMTRRFSRKVLPKRSASTLDRLIKYGGYTLVVLMATKKAGFDVSALLGAAGIAGIAIGFAAQTSVANIISGLFLFSEKLFSEGDILQVDSITGVVKTVDLMCIRLQTFDGRLVRVPNETLIKTNIINISYFPQRRFDLWLSLPNDSDLKLAMSCIQKVVDAEVLALKDPAPVLVLDAITPDGTNLLVGVWFLQENLGAIKNSLIPAVLSALAEKGIKPQARRFEIQEPAKSAGLLSAQSSDSAGTSESPKDF
ncbi:MAG: mechanosensitive ion channel family protein [Spirochaetia bacterium]|jgi:small-conductance mechanosensitive channel|nr:mechanosensitive ion channel family protein [Spirochaetales bacterium]MDX9783357.1 mechanosensitive ion channel family protein [Spirochaetia bacterium]